MGGAACSEVVLPTQSGWLIWIVSWLRSWFYGPTISLHDCLAAFFSTDELKGDNMYSCERCNKLRNGIKFSKVLQLPEVLCIHLKRFRHELMFSSKISSFVSFPLKGLDVRPYLHSDCTSNVSMFELFAVICHHGTAGGGHYTCFSLNGNQWYEFDDQYVTKVTAETVQASEAYVLFYRKNTSTVQTIKAKASDLAEICGDASEETVYISKQWLNRFKTCAEPGPIDNSDFLCHHNLLHPERSIALHQLAVVLPKRVYDYLHKKFRGCYTITVSNAHICSVCQLLLKRLTIELDTFLKLNRDFLSHRLPSTHLLSTAWFDQWQNFVQRRINDPPGPIENTRLLSDTANDYIEINQDIWLFFYNIYGGGPELPIFQNKIVYPTSKGINICSSGKIPQSTDVGATSFFKIPISKGNKQCSNHHVKVMETTLQSDCMTAEAKMDDAPSCDASADVDNSFDVDMYSNNNISYNCNNSQHSPNLSSRSSTSVTDDEAGQGDLNDLEYNKIISKTAKEKLHYKTRRRRFRCKIGYKSKHINSSTKSFKHKGFC